MRVTRPGIMSVLPARFGTQTLWLTSAEPRNSSTGSPTGRCSSFADVTAASPSGRR